MVDKKYYSRELFSFLSAEYLYEMFLEKKKPQELIENIKKKFVD